MSQTPNGTGSERAPLPEMLLRDKLVATLPDRVVPSLVAAVEVMVQEGITCFSFPVGQLDQLASLSSLFGQRAVFAVHDVDEADLESVLARRPGLVQLRRPDPSLARRFAEAGIAVALPALTPTEVQQAWDQPVSAVVVVPAEVMGSSYPEALAPLVPGTALMARGGLGAYSARRWCEAGAVALWLDDALLGDVVSGGSLSGLRERCQTFRSAVDPA